MKFENEKANEQCEVGQEKAPETTIEIWEALGLPRSSFPPDRRPRRVKAEYRDDLRQQTALARKRIDDSSNNEIAIPSSMFEALELPSMEVRFAKEDVSVPVPDLRLVLNYVEGKTDDVETRLVAKNLVFRSWWIAERKVSNFIRLVCQSEYFES